MQSRMLAWDTADSRPQYRQTRALFGDPDFVTVALDEGLERACQELAPARQKIATRLTVEHIASCTVLHTPAVLGE